MKDLTLDEKVALLNHVTYAIYCRAYRKEQIDLCDSALRKCGALTDDDPPLEMRGSA